MSNLALVTDKPKPSPNKYISLTDTAKMIRKALKQAFPVVKFSVTSKRYSGGSSIDVAWTDGPTTSTVEQITKQFESATFDSMADMKEYKVTMIDGCRVHYGPDWVFSSRRISERLMRDAAIEVCFKYNIDELPMVKTQYSSCYVDDRRPLFEGWPDTIADEIHKTARTMAA